MFETFTSMFNHSLLTLQLTPPTFKTTVANTAALLVTVAFNTTVRAIAIYGGIRLIATAFSHGSF